MNEQIKYVVGQTYKTNGLNSKCNPVILKVVLIEILPQKDEFGRDCLISDKGFKVLASLKDLF